ncbi:alpha-1,4-N-acetylglucosaminyltransferase-like [Gastrophryne carolinensis]
MAKERITGLLRVQPLYASAMMKTKFVLALILVIFSLGFLNRFTLREEKYYITKLCSGLLIRKYLAFNTFNAKRILRCGNGILFVETTERMEPPSLVLCAIESAARVYPERPVVFFMKGLEDVSSEEEEQNVRDRFPSLLFFDNIYFFPLKMEELFADTPLMPWFQKVDPKQERFWAYVTSDACRFAMMWKYGGIYMDADVISVRSIPNAQFLAAEAQYKTSSSVFALSQFHNLSWWFMEDFVQNYRGDVWGHQGPQLFTRVVRKFCGMPVFNSTNNLMCANIPYLHPHRFYPISYQDWKKYFEVWANWPSFENSYALHVWNFMNKNGKTMEPGSNTLMEHLYQKYCPNTYGYVLRNGNTPN